MRKPEERLEYEISTSKFWARLFKQSPEAAFNALTQYVLDLEWDSICQDRLLMEGTKE